MRRSVARNRLTALGVAAVVALVGTLLVIMTRGVAPEVGLGELTSERGSRLTYVTVGDRANPTVVLLHGLPETSQSLVPVALELSDDFFVVAPDLPGFGRSQLGPSVDSTVADVAAELAYLLDRLQLRDVTLVVTDVGVIGVDWARTRSGAVRCVVAYETALAPIPPDVTDAGLDEIERTIVTENALAERNLQAGTLRDITDQEIQVARESLPPTRRRLAFSLMEETLNNDDPFPAIFEYLAAETTNLTVIAADPGTTLTPDQLRRFAGDQLPHAAVIDYGPGLHYLATDDPARLSAVLRTAVDIRQCARPSRTRQRGGRPSPQLDRRERLRCGCGSGVTQRV